MLHILICPVGITHLYLKSSSAELLSNLTTVIKTKKNEERDQSKVSSFVEEVAKNVKENNGDHYKIHTIFQINCFVLVITLV